MEPHILRRGLCSAQRPCARTIELVLSATSRINHDGPLYDPNFYSRNFSISSRRNAFRSCETFSRSFSQKGRGTVRHISVAAVRSFRRTVSLPALDKCVLDVGHSPAESALHEIVCISSVGFSSGIRGRTAYRLWLRSDGRRISSRVAS